MNTRHTPSLELCQELDQLCKEKGIEVPETEFIWMNQPIYDHMGRHHGASAFQIVYTRGRELLGCNNKKFPAPLVSEQGEWLPYSISGKNRDGYYLVCDKAKEDWHVGYDDIQGNTYTQQTADTEANARQKMLNYLIAEGIITKL